MKDIDTLISELTLEEKACLVSGHKSWHTVKIPRLDIPSIFLTDGPHGLRKKAESSKEIGLGATEPSTAFPPAVTSASSWNKPLLHRVGEAMGRECNYYDVALILGPALNIKRNPMNGRSFEYFSEDPLISGEMGAELALGIEERGVGTSIKHFAANNNESNRYMGDSVLDERALREIYLEGFRRIIKKAKPATVMCSYNKVNGVYASENSYLLNDVLRTDWGYEGLVMSDWGAVNDRVRGIAAGLDLEMPGDIAHTRQSIVDAVGSGELPIEVLDQAVRRVLTIVERGTRTVDEMKITEPPFEAHADLALEVAEESAVLMKNEGGILPLKRDTGYLVVGEMFENMRYQGAGSSLLNPYKLVSPKDAFDSHSVDYAYERGYNTRSDAPDKKLEEAALVAAAEYETVLFFGGLTEDAESEGFDRKDMSLPKNQLSLIEKLVEAGKRIVLVLYGGSPVLLPFADEIDGILNMYLPGEMGGEATYSLLYGEVSPSGRLAETWQAAEEDIPFGGEFVKTTSDIYKESIFVGYRYFETYGVEVAYPFGYGLSYSRFSYRDMTVERREEGYTVRLKVKNEGEIPAREVVEVYIDGPETNLLKPKRKLCGFTKVSLAPGEERTVEVPVDIEAVSHYIDGKWRREAGAHTFVVASDVETPILTCEVDFTDGEALETPAPIRELYSTRERMLAISDEDFEAVLGREIARTETTRPYDLNTPMRDYKTLGGRFILGLISLGYNIMKFFLSIGRESPEKHTKIKNLYFGYMTMFSMTLRSLSYASEGLLSHRQAEGMLELANNHPLRALWKLLTPERALKLPKQD